MGINLGIALGAAAESGTQSYALFKKIQREDEQLARDRERFERERKDWQEKDQANALMRQAYTPPSEADGRTVDQAVGGLAGADASGNRMTPEGRAALTESLKGLPPEQAQAALQAYGKAYGGEGQSTANAGVYQGKQGLYVTDKAYNPEQAYVDSALRSGNPTALREARANQLTGLQLEGAKQNLKKGEFELRSLERSEQRDTKFREAMDTLHQKSAKALDEVEATAQTGGMKGLVERYGADLKKAYGMDVALVGNNIVVKDSKGKTVQTISNLDQAKAALGQHFQQDFAKSFERELMPLFGSPKELADYLNKREEIGLKGREVSAKEALVPSEINRNNAAANQANAHASLYGNMLKVAKDNQAAGAAMQPYLDKIAALKDPTGKDADEAELLLMQAATAGAQKSKDIAGLLATMRKKDSSGIDAEWSAKEDKFIAAGMSMQERAKEREAFYASKGFAPAARAAAVESGKWPDGKPMSATDVAEFNRRYPNSRIDPASLSWLKPAEPKTAPTVETKPAEALPTKSSTGTNFYSSEAAASRREAQLLREKKIAEDTAARDAEKARVRAAIAEDFAKKYK